VRLLQDNRRDLVEAKDLVKTQGEISLLVAQQETVARSGVVEKKRREEISLRHLNPANPLAHQGYSRYSVPQFRHFTSNHQ
jgi:hypothetical protein